MTVSSNALLPPRNSLNTCSGSLGNAILKSRQNPRKRKYLVLSGLFIR
jgi:hypothetical protein